MCVGAPVSSSRSCSEPWLDTKDLRILLSPNTCILTSYTVDGQTYDHLSHGTSPLSINLVAQTNREVKEGYPQEVRWPLGVCDALPRPTSAVLPVAGFQFGPSFRLNKVVDSDSPGRPGRERGDEGGALGSPRIIQRPSTSNSPSSSCHGKSQVWPSRRRVPFGTKVCVRQVNNPLCRQGFRP